MPDSLEARLTTLARALAKETVILAETLTHVIDVRWDRSPATSGPSERIGVRSNDAPADPTADAALDPHRLYLSTVLKRSEKPLRAALVGVRGVRRGLELALERFMGPEEDAA